MSVVSRCQHLFINRNSQVGGVLYFYSWLPQWRACRIIFWVFLCTKIIWDPCLLLSCFFFIVVKGSISLRCVEVDKPFRNVRRAFPTCLSPCLFYCELLKPISRELKLHFDSSIETFLWRNIQSYSPKYPGLKTMLIINIEDEDGW